ncbi:MAG: helix-hairpin-helix domain-containing protein [Planctomycetota bacterium]|nr:helix-hairpin-helix domain-containing protein [Planctomycetota bacterium]MED5399886.1 helix-hairpin-helix domain-containing protein [Planctomycetota bacterium]MEE3284760.1 helix-hairpin-helix domain-containing protein [Planctomycetota bacterium]
MDDSNETVLGITRGDRLVVGLLVVAALTLLATHWAQLSGWGTQPIEIDRIPRTPAGFRLDLNSANWAELSQLEGIGETLARRIVADREQNGRFTRVEDLQRVRGIGPRTVLRLKPWLTTDPRL